MRIRHRIPSIFNLSMVDVLCCALGCVILLWLVNLREAKAIAEKNEQSEQKNEQSEQALRVTTAERDDYKSERDLARTERDDIKQRLAAADNNNAKLKDEITQATTQLKTVRTDRDDLKNQLDAARLEASKLKDQKAAADARIAKQETANKDLDAKLSSAFQRTAFLENQVRDKDAQAGKISKQADEMATKLSASESRIKELQALADQVPALKDEVKANLDKYKKEEALASALEKEIAKRTQELGDSGKKVDDLQALKATLQRDIDARDRALAAAMSYRDLYAAAELRLRMAEKELSQIKTDLALAGQSIQALQTEKTALSGEAARARADADNRFAGIALTGHRVIFLVDMSGSMELVDENTVAPEKWQGVRESLLKIMRSLPGLEKYQVIVFSDKSSFLLGMDNQWLDYDPKTSADQINKALTALKPRGGTNMYTAMETAFRFRPSGLDTIYLFSDGIPNQGEGLPPNAANLKESEQSQILGEYILKMLKTKWNQELAGRTRVRINAVGFFYETHEVGAFLWKLARENDGSFVGMSKP